MYVCKYVCMYVCMIVCMHVWLYVCMYLILLFLLHICFVLQDDLFLSAVAEVQMASWFP